MAVVTGAGSGIGRAIARRLAVDGYAVVASDVDAGAATRVAEEIDGVSVTADVTDPEAVWRLGEFVSERFERLDLWVANAGVSRMSPFVDIPLESFDRTMAVNLRGVFLCGQVAARRMIDKGGGAIVNVASMAGKQGRTAFLADYVASKFAVIGLTQAMAYELGPYGVRVNSVCPGFVDTPMQDRHLSWGSALRGVGAEELPRPHGGRYPSWPAGRARRRRRGGCLPGQRLRPLYHRGSVGGQRRCLHGLTATG